MATPGEITTLLSQWRSGDVEAMNRLFKLVYGEMYEIARNQRRRVWSNHTLDTTALVHETFLKLHGQAKAEWENRAHFLAVAATAMRHILINYAEQKRTQKRGGDWYRVTLNEAGAAAGARAESLLAIEQALTQLENLDPRLARIVEYRFFGGLTEK